MPPLPMFPLGTVLFPSAVLPLHVFEERYRRLVRDCLAGVPELGVVLIERGSEVGGDDVRTSVGTVARIVEAAELPDGRFALGTVGVRRIRVVRWLEDAPYPRADVEDWPDADADPEGDAIDDLAARLDPALARLRRALALAAELGEAAAPATIELADDPVLASYQAAAVAPLGPLDRHRLLGCAGAGERSDALADLLDGAIHDLEARLAGG